MSDRKLRLEVILQAIDKATRPIRGIVGGNKALAKALKVSRDRLKELGDTQKQIGAFRELRNGLRSTSAELRGAEQRVRELAEKLKATEHPTRAMTREFNQAVRATQQLKQQHQQQGVQLQVLRDRLSGAGISTRNLGTHERQLRTDLAATNAAIADQQTKLAGLSAQQKKAAAARERMQKAQGAAANMAVAGYATQTVGGHILGGVKPALDEAKAYQREVSQFRALGVGEPSLQEAITFANGMNVKGLSQRDSLKLLKESYSITRDMHHAEEIAPMLAKMKFGIEAVMAKAGHGEGHGEVAEQMLMDLVKTAELRGSLKSPEAFKQAVNDATKAYVASGGTVKPEDLLNAIKTGGIAAKQLGDNSFYFGLLHTMQEMGGFRAGTGLMSAYSNWAQGRSTQQSAEELAKAGLLDPGAVKYGKTGHITKVLPDALKQVELYKTDPFQYLMDVVIPKINPDGTLNDQQVISRIGQMFSARKGGDLFASLYLERANIQKHMAAAPKAYGVDPLYDEAGKNAQGQEIDWQAKVNNLSLALGKEVLPTYSRVLEMTTALVKATSAWMNEHPVLAKVLMIVAGVLGALLLVGGSLTIALAATLGPMAMVTFAASALGLSFGAVLLAAGAVVAGIALVATAGVLLYQYWEPINGFFSGLWNEVRTAFAGGIGAIAALIVNWSPMGLFYQAFAAVLTWFGIELPGKFTEFGANILRGLVDGIMSGLGWVKNAITSVADTTVNFFKEKLGIHSPSRVFAELGSFTMAGLDAGLADGQRAPLATLRAFTQQLAGVGAGLALGVTTLPALAAVPIDTRPPLTATRAAGAAVAGGRSGVVINVYPSAGMDEARLAQLVAQRVDALQRQDQARRRSRLADTE